MEHVFDNLWNDILVMVMAKAPSGIDDARDPAEGSNCKYPISLFAHLLSQHRPDLYTFMLPGFEEPRCSVVTSHGLTEMK